MTAEQDASAWRAWLELRTCWHEAGHGIVGVLLGRPPEIISTRPGETFAGITHFATIALPDTSRLILGPLVTQDPPLRDYVERGIMVDLAGPVAGLCCPPPAAGHIEEDGDDERAASMAAALARQSPRHRELLVAAEERTKPWDGDEDSAWAGSGILVAPSAVVYHVEWLRAETRDLLERHGRQLAALAAALHERHVLTSVEIDAVLAGTRCICHRWQTPRPIFRPPDSMAGEPGWMGVVNQHPSLPRRPATTE